MTKKDKFIKQIELQEKVQKLANINIVTCGNCGSILLHERNKYTICCCYCNRKIDVSDCCDYLYRGMENNSVW